MELQKHAFILKLCIVMNSKNEVITSTQILIMLSSTKGGSVFCRSSDLSVVNINM
jgi:hypothetical protein